MQFRDHNDADNEMKRIEYEVTQGLNGVLGFVGNLRKDSEREIATARCGEGIRQMQDELAQFAAKFRALQ